MSKRDPDISIIVVSYNTRDLLAECLNSFSPSEQAGLAEVWVVDNGSTDDSAELVAARFPNAHLIRNGRNLGFAAANNQALRLARGRLLFLVNSDARLIGDCCHQMQAVLAADERLGIVGPCLLNVDGSQQPSWGSFPSPLRELVFQSFLFKVWPSGLPYGRHVHPLERAAYRRFHFVDWVTGAAFMLRREVYDALGGLPEETFMYAEDLEYCWRAKRAGFRVAYCPSACVYHSGQASARRNYQHWIESYTGSLLSYYERHCSPADLRAAACLIWCGSLMRHGLWQIVGLARPSRQLEVGSRIAGYSRARALASQVLRAHCGVELKLP